MFKTDILSKTDCSNTSFWASRNKLQGFIEKVSEHFKERLIFKLPEQDYAGCAGEVEVTS